MADSKEGAVGYRRPPKNRQWKKGQSGNPAGLPHKQKPDTLDVTATLDAPMEVKQGGEVTTMHPYEVAVRQLLRKVLQDKNLTAAIAFLRRCEKYKLLNPPATPPAFSPFQYIPRDWDEDEWKEMLFRRGPPPWPGPRNGLCKNQT